MIIKSHEIPKIIKGHWSTTGLVGYWPMMPYEVFGSTVFDLSGNGNHLTNIGSPVWVSGKYGSALDYNGSNNYSEKTSPIGMSSLPMTIILYGQRESDTTHSPLISLGKSGVTQDQIWVSVNNGTPQGTIFTGGANSTVGTSSIAVGEKTHLAFVIASAIDRKLYVNGILEGTDTDSDTFPSVVNYVGISTLNQSARSYYAGINEFASIYNRVLSASEVAELFLNPLLPIEREPIELWVGATSVGVPTGIAAYTHHYQQQL